MELTVEQISNGNSKVTLSFGRKKVVRSVAADNMTDIELRALKIEMHDELRDKIKNIITAGKVNKRLRRLGFGDFKDD